MADIFYATLCQRKADSFAIFGKPEQTPIYVCHKDEKVVDVLKVCTLTPLLGSSRSLPSLPSLGLRRQPALACASAAVCSSTCQGLIKHNVLSAPVLHDNGKSGPTSALSSSLLTLK